MRKWKSRLWEHSGNKVPVSDIISQVCDLHDKWQHKIIGRTAWKCDEVILLRSLFSIARLIIQPWILAGCLVLIRQSNSYFSVAYVKVVSGFGPVLCHTKRCASTQDVEKKIKGLDGQRVPLTFFQRQCVFIAGLLLIFLSFSVYKCKRGVLGENSWTW